MNILIIGAGALGIGVGASLVDSGCEVDFIAKGETKDAIQKRDRESVSGPYLQRFQVIKYFQMVTGIILMSWKVMNRSNMNTGLIWS